MWDIGPDGSGGGRMLKVSTNGKHYGEWRLCAIVPLTLACAGLAMAADCPLSDATPPATPLTYPMTSDRYAVQYSIGGGPWTNGQVYISYYGGTNASPYRGDSGYTLPYQTPTSITSPVKPPYETSLSFVSIPTRASTYVQLRVTKLFGTPFQPGDHVSVRPGSKFIDADTLPDGTVQITRVTSAAFTGEQFILWWERGAEGGAVEGLAFFLNPPYQQPAGGNVLVVKSWGDLANATQPAIDTLDFEGPLPIELWGTGMQAYTVPDNIRRIFLGSGAWVQGKLRFNPIASNPPTMRSIYGPGVLDVSRFSYLNRACPGDNSLYALTSTTSVALDHFHIDGIVIIDHNHAANHSLFNSTVNNVKTLGWNGENAALRLGDNTTASNLFIRSGDDSLMMWGSSVMVTNTTVWQNYNGGVVNLGWGDNSPGDLCSIDGLYVVKTDWSIPTASTLSWNALVPSPGSHPLQGQNNAVFASLMVPGTQYGKHNTPVFKNIFVEDPPQVLFSLKILPPICAQTGFTCASVDLKSQSLVQLNIENLFTPASVVGNSIGFQNVPAGYPNPLGTPFTADSTMKGTMNIGLKNVFIRLPQGFWLPLDAADAVSAGKLRTNGSNVNIGYSFGLP
jgi:hypothetical protein